jgi:hypothetical protein|tara:strand:- start:1802 stop:2323 length:522 start_codon:yes stop_codon:yes gene_type:complete
MSEAELDVSWIESYKELEKNFDDFYKEKSENIEMFFLYVNSEDELETVNSSTYILDVTSRIPKDRLVNVIKEHREKNKKKYRLINIIKYNVTLDPEDVIHMLNVDNREGDAFITHESYNHDIHFADTVCILQNLNSLYFVFRETPNKAYSEKQRTRKITMSPNINEKTRRKRI